MKKYYTISEASKYVNADPSTLRRWEYELSPRLKSSLKTKAKPRFTAI